MTDEYVNIYVCMDCYHMHHFGTIGEEMLLTGLYSPEWDADNGHEACVARAEEREAEVLAAYMAEGGDRYISDNTDANHEHTDECDWNCDATGLIEFTWHSCQMCRSHLGGSRYRLAIWPPQPEEAQ